MEGFQVRGDLPPARRPDKPHRVIYPRPGEPVQGWIIHAAPLGVTSHWIAADGVNTGRTVMCAAPGPCVCSSAATPTRWQGYLGIASDRYKEPCVLTLPQTTWWALSIAAKNLGYLRGMRIKLTRATAHKNSPATLVVMEAAIPTGLTPEFDIVPTLRALYGSEAVDCWLGRSGTPEAMQ